MSKFLDRLRYFKQVAEPFSGQHGQTLDSNRDWEDGYRSRWQHDKIVRSTHGVNCTGSCSWKIYVKNGLVTWETQQTDYPRTRPDLPNHEPRGCPRGASYSWYLYSANRLKYPLVRKSLIAQWRAAKAQQPDPVLAWQSIVENTEHPEQALIDHPDELLLALMETDELDTTQQALLAQFIRNFSSRELLDWQADYCELFDRGRATSLLLFEHVHGESRDRGQAMVDLMAQYRADGLDLDARATRLFTIISGVPGPGRGGAGAAWFAGYCTDPGVTGSTA